MCRMTPIREEFGQYLLSLYLVLVHWCTVFDALNRFLRDLGGQTTPHWMIH